MTSFLLSLLILDIHKVIQSMISLGPLQLLDPLPELRRMLQPSRHLWLMPPH